MSEKPAVVPDVKQKRKRATSDGRAFTFVFMKEDGSIGFGNHRTKAFSKDEAWKEFAVKHAVNPESKYVGFIGQCEEMPKKIRKPSREELLKLAGLED